MPSLKTTTLKAAILKCAKQSLNGISYQIQDQYKMTALMALPSLVTKGSTKGIRNPTCRIKTLWHPKKQEVLKTVVGWAQCVARWITHEACSKRPKIKLLSRTPT